MSGSLALEANGRLLVFKSFPSQEPKVRVLSLSCILKNPLNVGVFSIQVDSPQKFGDFVLTSENPLQDKMSSTLFAYPAKTNTAAATIFLNLDFEGTP